MKCKTFTTVNAAQAEEEFNKWVEGATIGIVSTMCYEHRGRAVWVVFYTGDIAEKDESPDPAKLEPFEAPPGVEAVEEDVDHDTLEAELAKDGGIICPFCGKLTKPAIFRSGPQEGKCKCRECLKTFEVEDGENDG